LIPLHSKTDIYYKYLYCFTFSVASCLGKKVKNHYIPVPKTIPADTQYEQPNKLNRADKKRAIGNNQYHFQ
ncbi:hypothetical protein, partial [Rummeliibacillus pycnus]|uniref:hypothetical protein n=1 Tax=Rummeliibacillus pycnus TaxID=101070 RepID=UPI003D2B4A44